MLCFKTVNQQITLKIKAYLCILQYPLLGAVCIIIILHEI